jgi:glutathione S-transferase
MAAPDVCPTLTYFDAQGAAEPIRTLLRMAGIRFQDRRVTKEDWPVVKQFCPFMQLPVFTTNGSVLYAQSHAIARYVARRGGLYPQDEEQALLVDMLTDSTKDFSVRLLPTHFEEDLEKRRRMREEVELNTLPTFLDRWNKMLGAEAEYLVNNTLSLADVMVYYVVENVQMLDYISKNLRAPYPGLHRHAQRMRERIAALPPAPAPDMSPGLTPASKSHTGWKCSDFSMSHSRPTQEAGAPGPQQA